MENIDVGSVSNSCSGLSTQLVEINNHRCTIYTNKVYYKPLCQTVI